MSEDVVYKLVEDLLDGGVTTPGSLPGEGRTLITENWYTSDPLTIGLLDHRTNFIGTIRLDQKYLPPEASVHLKKEEIISRETEEGLYFRKWKDKRDVTLFSTVHKNETVDVTTERGSVKIAPLDVVQYNTGKVCN